MVLKFICLLNVCWCYSVFSFFVWIFFYGGLKTNLLKKRQIGLTS